MAYLTQANIHHFTNGTPIYHVMAEYPRTYTNGYSVMTILEVTEMFLEDFINGTVLAQELSAKISLCTHNGKAINTYIFSREPNNPFQNWQPTNTTNLGTTQRPMATGPVQKSVDDEIREASQDADYNSSDAW